MNLVHRWLCRSALWRKTVEAHILPWTLEGIPLGSHVLEIGPGPGITTDLLRSRVPSLTCVEIDESAAASLQKRTAGQNVTVLHQDATAMSFPAGTFDTVLCFTMLHHVPSVALQDRLLEEAFRVLRPGGIFAGTDSVYSPAFRLLHLFDTMVIVDPKTFSSRLNAAGFVDIQVDANQHAFRFRARVPPYSSQ